MELSIQLRQPAHDTNAFSSGVDALDSWIRQVAGQHARKGISRTYVAVERAAPKAISGYCSLTVAQTDAAALPPAIGRKLPHTVPAVLIGRLAVARTTQGKGVGAKLLLDGVSSFGAEAIDFENGGIIACAGTANKCLHGAPGVSFVVVRRDALFASNLAPRTLYLDLANACREQDQRSTAFTQPIHVFHALAAALREFQEAGGVSARHRQYANLATEVRGGLVKLGIEPLLPAKETSVVLSAYRVPAGITYESLHDQLKARGFVIYAGQGRFKDNIFRISTMGAIGPADIARLVDAFEEILR